MKAGLLCSAVLLAAAGVNTHGPTPPSDQERQKVDRAIYEVVFRSIFRGQLPDKLVIEDQPILPMVPDEPDWQTALSEVPRDLRTRLESGPPAGSGFEAGSLPDGARLVPRADIETVLRSVPLGTRVEDLWAPFRERWGVSSWQAVSRPITTEDQRDALVYYEHHCRGLCGEGVLLWLHRDRVSESWSIRKVRPFWTS